MPTASKEDLLRLRGIRRIDEVLRRVMVRLEKTRQANIDMAEPVKK
jgi:hypothetical protein